MNPLANWIIAISWETFAAVWVIGLLFTKRTVRAAPHLDRLVQMAVLILGFCLMAGPWAWPGPFATQMLPRIANLQIAGAALTAAGCLFAIWARVTLGGNWSGRATVKANHELIVRGPYALARHPIYTGILTAAFGTGLAVGKWRCLLGFVLAAATIAIKMRQEEKLMSETFPGQYPRYRERVKALIPGVL
jgi:protein-S-isoprenylcysteine O-methyltransferase Ste14